jgi:hypothetical protein
MKKVITVLLIISLMFMATPLVAAPNNYTTGDQSGVVWIPVTIIVGAMVLCVVATVTGEPQNPKSKSYDDIKKERLK